MTLPDLPRRSPGGSAAQTFGRIPDWDAGWRPGTGWGDIYGAPRPRFAPPAPLTVVSVTVGDGTAAPDMASARVYAALTYIRLRVAIMENAGHGDRIDTAEHARRRGDEIAPRSTVGEICRESAALLLGAGMR